MDIPRPKSTQANQTAPAERRHKQRAQLHIKADVTLPGDLTLVSHTLDISAAGLSIVVPYRLEVGQHCDIELNLAKLGGPSWVRVVGEVRRCVETDKQRFEAGLQFVELDSQVSAALDTYVWSRLAAK